MATSTGQRVGIWIIAVALTVGTLAGFIAMILAPENEATQNARLEKAYAEYQKEYEAYDKKVQEQAKDLSKKYYPIFKQYKDEPSKFDTKSVTKLDTKDLKVGRGEKIDGDTKFAAYYIGWNPQGKVFDQSIEGEKLKAPLPISEGLDQASLIEGWKEGMKGMRIGGVRLIEIPAGKAYGETGQGEDIPPNTPLKFIVMAIEKPADIEQPEYPQELLNVQ